MNTNDTTLPAELARFLATDSTDNLTSMAAYVERGGALVTPRALVALRALRRQNHAKIAGLEMESRLRNRLEVLALFHDELSEEGGALTVAVRETAFALLYFHAGVDRIPDSIPEIGLLDDALIVQTVLQRHAAALRAHWLRHGRTWPAEL
jgi:uncharacterized membrane protein YkvA (DUF1232 family)